MCECDCSCEMSEPDPKPTVDQLMGGIAESDQSKVLFYDTVLDSEPDVVRNAGQRKLYDILDEHSPYRSRGEIRQKYNEFTRLSSESGLTERERAIVIDTLCWVITDNAEWVIDDWADESSDSEMSISEYTE